MPPMTTGTPWIPDATLATRWQEFTSSLSGARPDIDGILQGIVQAEHLDTSPLLVYARGLLTNKVPQPTTTDDLLDAFRRFITQGVADHSGKIADFEQRLINGFRSHAALSLTASRSFRPGALRITNGTLDSLLRLIDELEALRTQLVQENTMLQKAFVDTDGSIILAHDRLHAIGNAFTNISGSAQLLRRDPNGVRQDEYLTALQTTISTMICAIVAKDTPSIKDDPIKLFRQMHPDIEIMAEGAAPRFIDDRHPQLIVTALDHLVRNAYEAGATEVRVKAEYQPSDPVFAIGIEDNGRGMPENLRQKLLEGKTGSGWRILREVTLRRLGATFNIQSPFQNAPQPHGTLVMIFIPVQARTGDEPSTGRARRADSGPLPARRDIKTPPHALPAIPKPASSSVGIDPNLAGGVSCFSERPTGVLLRFPILK